MGNFREFLALFDYISGLATQTKALVSVRKNPDMGITTSSNQLYRQMFDMLERWNMYGVLDYDLKSFVDDGYASNPHVFSVIGMYMMPAGALDWYVYDLKDKGALKSALAARKARDYGAARYLMKRAVVRVENTPYNEMIDKGPNEFMSWPWFVMEAMGYKGITGNDFMYKLVPDGYKETTKIYNTPAQMTEIVPGTHWTEPMKGVRIQLGHNLFTDIIPREKMLHIKNFNPRFDSANPAKSLYGMSPLEPLCRVYKRSNKSLERSYALVSRGITPGILTPKGSDTLVKEKDVKLMQDTFDTDYSGEKAGRPMFTGIPMDWLKLGLNSTDLELILADKADLDSIARAYRVPMALVSDKASTYNNIVESEKRLWANAIIPELDQIRDALNRWMVVPESNGRLWIDYDLSTVESLNQGELERSKRLLAEMEHGILNGQQYHELMGHELENMDTIPEFKKYMIRNNLRYTDEKPAATGGFGAQAAPTANTSTEGD